MAEAAADLANLAVFRRTDDRMLQINFGEAELCLRRVDIGDKAVAPDVHGADVFDVAHFPTAHYVTKSFTKTASGYTANQSKGSTDANDQVFGTSAGGDSYQLLTVSGDNSSGYVASIIMGVSA